jgi:hypothetical protein
MALEKTERELLHEISERLNKIIGLLAIEGKSQNHQIEILSALGFDSKTTGLFVGLSGDAVRQRKTQMKRQDRK